MPPTLVRPGGTLVYAVCSLEPEEGEGVVNAFLERNSDFHIATPENLPDGVTPTADGFLRILPGCSRPKAGSTASSSRRLSARAKTR